MKTDLFFVYGTLKVGGRFAKLFDSVRVNSTLAEVDGFDLFDLGPYPCILPGDGKVVGELHEYKNPDEVTEKMDRIEGYNSEDDHGMYLRRRVEVRTKDGKIRKANIYVFGRPVSSHTKKISSGIWGKQS